MMSPKITLDQPGEYRIRVQGRLGEKWAIYFDGMAITYEVDSEGNTVTDLAGELLDQGAVQGVLQKLYNLGFPLISAEIVRTDSSTTID
jgi:hypothetical protein